MDENALATQVSGDDETERSGAIDPGFETEQEAEEVSHEDNPEQEPYSIKKRLGMQAKKHQREIRHLHDRIEQLTAHLVNADSANPEHLTHQNNPYNSPGQPNPPGMNEQERIQHAVRLAMGMKDQEEKQAKHMEHQAHVHKQYERLNNEFDRAADKYDDFDDVVRGDDIPFTPHVRDALLLVDNPADVAYKLGKNRSELERISKLHPLDQAREVNKLSFSLMGGNEGKTHHANKSTPLGTVRANPAGHGGINEKSTPSQIRARMKAGTFK